MSISRPPDETPEVLYHYTSQEGLLGILESRQLWATKIHFLNDSREFKLALDLVLEELSSRKDGAQEAWEIGEIDLMRSSVLDIEEINVCVISFSKNGDLLSQWRGYGNRHGSYAIGFNSERLLKSLIRWQFDLVPCSYSPEDQKAMISEPVESELKLSRQLTNGNETEPAESRIREPLESFGEALTRIAPRIKHPTFKEEEEWRLVSRPVSCASESFCFRPGDSMLIPYYKAELVQGEELLPIERVYVGPSPNMDLAVSSVKALFFKVGLKDCEVKKSTVPFRSW